MAGAGDFTKALQRIMALIRSGSFSASLMAMVPEKDSARITTGSDSSRSATSKTSWLQD